MEEGNFDVAIIGAGPGGYVAALRAAHHGLKVACIEKGSRLGGTCLNVGCIPSKTLLHATEVYSFLKGRGRSIGIEYSGLTYDFSGMMKNKEEVVAGLTRGIATLFEQNKITAIQGTATFIDPENIEITGSEGVTRVKARHYILATGSAPSQLPFLPFDEKVILSSTGVLALKKVPEKLIVIGAGVIGVELASVYCRLGSNVILIEMLDHICNGIDKGMGKALFQQLKKQGLTFHLGARITEGKISDGNARLSFTSSDGSQQTVSGDAVLVAVGRRPYSEGLALDKAGIDVDSRGFVPVDNGYRTAAPRIFAIGDLVAGPMLAHRASDEGVAVADIIAGISARVNIAAIPNVIYTHPEVASVGLTEEEAHALGLTTIVGSSYFRGNARARCSNESEGMVKMIGDRESKRLIGLHIIGPHASELIAEGAVAIEAKATVADIAAASHAHPTLSEAVREAAFSALGEPLHG